MARSSFMDTNVTGIGAGNVPSGGAAFDLLGQLQDETDEQRKKRLQDEAQRRALGPLASPMGLASRTLGLGSYGSANAGRGGY